MSGYAVQVTTGRGTVLWFPHYGPRELPAAMVVAETCSWVNPDAKVIALADGRTVATYRAGFSRYLAGEAQAV